MNQTTEAKDKTDNPSDMIEKTDNEIIAGFMKYPYIAVKAGFENKGSYTRHNEDFESLEACLAYCNDVNDGEDPEQCFFPKPMPTFFADFTLKYDTSFDWLMPVVFKISSLGYKFTIKCDRFSIELPDRPGIHRWIGDDRIKGIFYGVVEFVQWYNINHANQPKPNEGL